MPDPLERPSTPERRQVIGTSQINKSVSAFAFAALWSRTTQAGIAAYGRRNPEPVQLSL
ncbi:MAG: hypothetical protein Kilf2KO_41810 [Rhodospirillales bacterium]